MKVLIFLIVCMFDNLSFSKDKEDYNYYIKQNKFEESEKILQNFDGEKEQLILALLYLNKKFENKNKATIILEKLSKNNTDVGCLSKGLLSYLKNDYKNAKINFEKSDKISYSNYYLGKIALYEGDTYKGIFLLEKASHLGDFRAIQELSNYYLKEREEQTLLLSDLILKEAYKWLLLGTKTNIKDSEIDFYKIEPFVLSKLKKESNEFVNNFEINKE